MKNSIKFFLAALVLVAAASCGETKRSSSNFVQVTNFDMDDYSIEQYFVNNLMYAPLLSWDGVCQYNSSADELNKGYRGGFVLSVRKGTEDMPDELALKTSADPYGGSNGSNGYMVFTQTSSMPEADITYDLSSFFTASTASYGCDVCNTLYNKRMQEQGLISSGDYLKVKAEFYKGKTLVGSLEKYLINYKTVEEPVMENEWVGWNMTKGSDGNNVTVTNFDSVKFTIETSGAHIDPSFCVDNYCVNLNVEY